MKTISIMAVVDVVSALSHETLADNLYLVDDNRLGGSRGEGSAALQTKVAKGDRIVWTALTLECEAYGAIADIAVDPAFCTVEKCAYRDSNVVCWIGEVKKDIDQPLPYTLIFKLGSRSQLMAAAPTHLTGDSNATRPS